MKKKIILLGSTGSIGTNTLDVISKHRHLFEVVGLSCGTQVDLLAKQCREFDVPHAVVSNLVKTPHDFPCRLFTGKNALEELIKETKADLLVNAIAGSSGLLPSVWALEHSMDLALANKETIVMAGNLVKKMADKKACKIIPIDSEHSAIFQLLKKIESKTLDEIILTASGGAFRKYSYEEMKAVTPEQALKHPTWNMGPKITIDSASMANKGLEIIEASYLFNLAVDKIKVVIHPQSLVHSMVRTIDGEIYAQLSYPDMRLPIHTALFYPETVKNELGKLDFGSVVMEFYPPEPKKFPMLKLAYEAASRGEEYTICYNAANEMAVSAFVDRLIGFLDIPALVEKALDNDWKNSVNSIDDILEADTRARKMVLQWINKR
ncbi:MAG: 1-deoxy-D-xylulose-5-phosphate reductoisomerase [Spirochaetales bacterium]|nr:1-deoxy-D-xylulose-5-phosphate reductoisomerase [Spirochaetales bacterium]